MTTTMNTEYWKLALDSSNDMIEHDADRTLGRYPKAAWRILQAGLAREPHGQMMFETANFSQAAADWLSAAACFFLATDPKEMQESLARVQKLDHEAEDSTRTPRHSRRDKGSAKAEFQAELPNRN